MFHSIRGMHAGSGRVCLSDPELTHRELDATVFWFFVVLRNIVSMLIHFGSCGTRGTTKPSKAPPNLLYVCYFGAVAFARFHVVWSDLQKSQILWLKPEIWVSCFFKRRGFSIIADAAVAAVVSVSKPIIDGKTMSSSLFHVYMNTLYYIISGTNFDSYFLASD